MKAAGHFSFPGTIKREGGVTTAEIRGIQGYSPPEHFERKTLGNAISSVLRCICDIFYTILLIVLMRKGMIIMKIFNKEANLIKLFVGRSSFKKGSPIIQKQIDTRNINLMFYSRRAG